MDYFLGGHKIEFRPLRRSSCASEVEYDAAVVAENCKRPAAVGSCGDMEYPPLATQVHGMTRSSVSASTNGVLGWDINAYYLTSMPRSATMMISSSENATGCPRLGSIR